MSAAIGRLSTVVINTTDVERLAPFWQALLGVERGHQVGEYFLWLRPQVRGGVSVALQKVEDPTPGTRRLHLDLQVEDIQQARIRIEELGGRHIADHAIGDFSWAVMEDVDGNQFCIARRG